MTSLLFAINAVAPIVIMICLGYLLKRLGFMDAELAKKCNKLVFRVFLPAMLFLNVYKIEDPGQVNLGFILYALVILAVVFVVSFFFVLVFTKDKKKRGALWQGSFRSNYALIGIPLAQSLFGTEGVIVATVLSAVLVPVYNILAVVSLTVCNPEKQRVSIKAILLAIVKNPLIQGVVLGLVTIAIRHLFVISDISFRLTDIEPIYTVLGYLSSLATPLALLVLGAQFEFSAISDLKREITAGVIVRTVLVPLLGIGVAYVFFSDRFGGAEFASLIAMLATPVAVSSVPMAQEMKSDVTLAGQLVVWTTIASAFSVFVASFLLSLAGIF